MKLLIDYQPMNIDYSTDDSSVSQSDSFPVKLHRMLERVENDGQGHIISWNPDGLTFTVHNPKLFVSDVLGKYFNQTKYKSFQRQMNIYNFERLSKGKGKGHYKHPYFVRSDRGLCEFIRRGQPIGARFRDFVDLRPVQAIQSNKTSIDDEIRLHSGGPPIFSSHNASEKRGEASKSVRPYSDNVCSNNLHPIDTYSNNIERQRRSSKELSRHFMAQKESIERRDGWAPPPLSRGGEVPATIFNNPALVSSQYPCGSLQNLEGNDDDISVESIDRDFTENDLNGLENFQCLPEDIFEL